MDPCYNPYLNYDYLSNQNQNQPELYAPIPISSQPISIVDFYTLPEPISFVDSPESYGAQESPSPTSTLAYSPLPTAQFPESQELLHVLSTMNLAEGWESTTTMHSPGSASDFSDYSFKAKGPVQSTFPTPSELLSELTAKGLAAPTDENSAELRNEPASKARRREMAKRIGFVPTDPDSISSHEKKRLYLESLEQYIVYLHEQFTLLGKEYPPIQHVTPDEYKEIHESKDHRSNSIRAIIVHMETQVRDLNARTVAEELKFVELRNELLRREGGTAPGPTRYI